MRAGLLKETITFQTVYKTKDDFGGIDFLYKDYLTTKARVVYRKGDRVFTDDATHGYKSSLEITHTYTIEFVVRGYHKINEDMVISYRGKKYRILSIDDITREQKTIITELIND